MLSAAREGPKSWTGRRHSRIVVTWQRRESFVEIPDKTGHLEKGVYDGCRAYARNAQRVSLGERPGKRTYPRQTLPLSGDLVLGCTSEATYIY